MLIVSGCSHIAFGNMFGRYVTECEFYNRENGIKNIRKTGNEKGLPEGCRRKAVVQCRGQLAGRVQAQR
jgi:hypothetical protein